MTTKKYETVLIEKQDGKVKIVKKHEQPTRHGAAHGLGWGLAAGAVAALFPAVGILGALTVGGGAGAAVGAVSGHDEGHVRPPAGVNRDVHSLLRRRLRLIGQQRGFLASPP